jgi:hypothetical protein
MRLHLTGIVAAGALALAGCGDGGGGDATTATSSKPAGYPANVENNFMTNCERTSNGNTTGCQCILDELERKFTLAEFTKEDQAVAAGRQPSKKFTDAVDTCR